MPTARKLLSEIVTDFAGKAPKAIECLENGFEDAMAVMAIPEPSFRTHKHSWPEFLPGI
jgi:hypothetical protein